MFKGLSNLASMMKQAQEIQGKMGEMQESLKSVHVEGEAGAGMVKVVVNGQQQVVSCQIEPSVLESGDREMLEELFVSAANQALDKSREAASSKMSELTEGMNFPGLQDALSNFTQK
ncbi:MAG: YbaB/EbfC family nucleoid-associated protein [Rubinisphaera brasiliensis]|uniref:YbaB/EbfC family nucleoid-associated protein n=1 Tax=Rubinisphaera brasiliensis TaxID=119 RepID=UPI003919ECE2|nr:YbaB/EbfC family nucleoid-associated protein [bacterium]